MRINNTIFDYDETPSVFSTEPSALFLNIGVLQNTPSALVSDVQIFQANPVNIASNIILGEGLITAYGGTTYTDQDNTRDSVIFGVSQANRLIDIEKELVRYEGKYHMKSQEFYENWRSKPELDQSDFNKWADLYRVMQYAQE